MYLDTYTVIAVCLALISQMILLVVLFRSNYRWEERYREVVRVLKTERAARR